MATGPEMLIQTLVRALKLEPEVDKLRQALSGDTIDQFKGAIEKVNSFDARLARIEIALNIRTGAIDGTGFEPGSNADDFGGEARLDRYDPPQLANGANRV